MWTGAGPGRRLWSCETPTWQGDMAVVAYSPSPEKGTLKVGYGVSVRKLTRSGLPVNG